MKKSKLIVILGPENILSTSISHFLATVKNWEIVRLSTVEELESLMQSFNAARTEVVVIDQRGEACPEYFSLKLLHKHPTLKVVMVSLDDNLVDVYSKKKIFAREVTDLVSAIENDGYFSVREV